MWRVSNPTDPDAPAARAARRVTLAATAVFVAVLCRWRPWNVFDRAGFSSDFYDEQARALLRGRLWVDPAVAGIEGFLIDGRTYFYFGPFLALARLPFALFGHTFDGRLTRLSMVVGFVLLCTAAYHLVVAARRWFGAAPSTWRTAGFVAAVAVSPALFLGGWVSVYHETELWAATFALWAVVGVLQLVTTTPTWRHALLTGGATAATLLTRASVGIGIAAGVGAVVLGALWQHRLSWRAALTSLGTAAAGLALHLGVNVARFGSLLGLPADRQALTLADPERAAWFAGNGGSFFGLQFVPTTVTHYLRPDTIRFERLLPLVKYGPLATDRGSYPMETIAPSASLVNATPVLVAAALVGLVTLLRRRSLTWLALTAGAALATVPTLTIAFIGNRYLVDMLPLVAIPSAVAFAVARGPRHVGLHRLARVLLVVALVATAWVNVALATWNQNLKEPGFTAWRYQVDDAVFGDPAPGLGLLDDQPPGLDGTIVLDLDPTDGSCDGVYIAEQNRWVPLERASGGRVIRGTMRAHDTRVVASGTEWRLELLAGDGLVSPVLHRGDTVVEGDHVPLETETVQVEVVIDPVVDELSVRLNGTPVYYSFDVPDGPVTVSSNLTLDGERGDSLCRQLAARR